MCDNCRCTEGYDLPQLEVAWWEVETDHSKAVPDRHTGQTRMFKDVVFSLSEAAAEKRDSLSTRIAKAVDILAASPDDHFLLWHSLEAERHAILNAIPEAVAIYGTQDLDERERYIKAFADGEVQYLAAKSVMLSCGVNLQYHCHRAVFIGIDFRFHDFLQACHRIHRYQQQHPVRIDMIYSEAERTIKKALEDKWARYAKQVSHMSKLIRDYGLAHAQHAHAHQRTADITRQEVRGERFTLINNDTIDETRHMAENSIDLIISSPPFSTQYEYTTNLRDFGHNPDNTAFWQQMDFLTPELYRVLRPGRIAAMHVKDRVTPGGITGLGFQTVTRFSDQCADHFEKHGFAFLGRKTIVTDVVRENAQTYRLGWTEQTKDGSRMGVGMSEYVLLFRKPPTDASTGYGDIPVEKLKPDTETPDGTIIPYNYDAGKIVPGTGYSRGRWQLDAHGLTRSSGNRFLTQEDLDGLPHADIYKRWKHESLSTIYDFTRHLAVCEQMEREKRLPSGFMLLPPHSWHPDVWTDVARMRTMNMEQERRGQEMHLCPMQFDIAERLILQLSMQDELVFDPFSGLATVPYMALKLGRRGLGVELNPRYHADGVRYCREAEKQRGVPTLFDLLEQDRPLPLGEAPGLVDEKGEHDA